MAACLLTVSFIAACLFFIFYYRFSFNYETEIRHQYNLVFFMPITAVIYLLQTGWKKTFSIKQIAALLIIIVVCILLLSSTYFSFGNEHFFICCSVYLLCSPFLFFRKTISFHIILLFLLLVFLYELGAGFNQLFQADDADNGDRSLLLTGSLQNSGIYGCYLVTQLPFAFYVFLQWKPLNNKEISALPVGLRVTAFLLIFATSLFMIYKTQSRTAYIASFVTTAAWVLFNYGAFIKQRILVLHKAWLTALFFVVLSFIGFAGYFLFGMKKMSAVGRMMKLQITLNHITDHFWLGTGLGRFTWYYPQWQAQYFKDHSQVPTDYFLSAGESYIIFNEYVQLLKEVGLIGFIVFAALLLYFFTSKSAENRKLMFTAKLTTTAVLACGFTSYPFHVNVFLLLLVFCFVLVFSLRENPFILKSSFFIHNRRLAAAVTGCVFLLTVLAGYQGMKAYTAIGKWNDIQNNYVLPAEAKPQLSPVYNVLNSDGKFLTEYGEWLAQNNGNGENTIAVLEEAKKFFITKQTVEATAQAYAAMRNYPRAIENMEWLSNYLPNRFTPMHELLKLYQLHNDKDNLQKAALKILNMPVKFPSAEVDQIKNEARLSINIYRSYENSYRRVH
ncbi:hypothetical protein A3860_33075 [Niastella vici]|uniref:O-antigen ligase-related domain-containing protein n=2 Tax=Niastella vici TaxID=1703345 RepID=A0A1V9FQE2_9BACT|nr:hypothetical protein A3860_33075 [Niastella vici]